MKNVSKQLLPIVMLLSVANLAADVTSGKSIFLPRAQNATAVELLGWTSAIHKFDMDSIYGSFKVQGEFVQNNKRSDIGKYLLMNDTDTAIWGPQKTTSTFTDTDVFAFNFLLDNSAFKSSLKFAPKAQAFVTNFSLFVGLDEWLEGLYVTFHAPLIHNRWEIELTETAITAAAGANFYNGVNNPIQYNTSVTIPYANITAAFVGDKTAGDVLSKWNYGTINGKQTDTRFGDIVLTLGYDFVSRENAHFGVGVRGLFGAGKKTDAKYVFQPIFGHAGRMGIGGVVDGHVRLWDRDDDNYLTGHLHANVVHLFANDQRRSFDLTNGGKWSRYLLLKKFTTISTTGNTVYAGLDNMINIGSLEAKIGIDVAYDATLMLNYHYNNLNFELGYNVGGHSKEKFDKWVDTIAADTWACSDPNVNLGAAKGTANTNSAYVQDKIAISGLETGTSAELVTSNKATYIITNDSLDQASGLAPSVLGHVVFGGLNYTWRDCSWAPSVGVYGKYEICGIDNNSFDQWGVGAQFNVSF